MIIRVQENVRLELIAQRHAKQLYQAVNNDRQHLAEFLPWVGSMKSVSDFTNYIKNCRLLYEQKKEVSFVILLHDVVVGRIGLHHLYLDNKTAAIGYWLTKDAQGQGIVINSCKKLIALGFTEIGLHRLEIKAATTNLRSQAIPEKLSFKKEGVLREAELVNDKFLDLYLYSLLSHEWTKQTTNH